jgi:UDP-N-acetylmuramoylalanine--D-glutamate ligase
MKERIVILGGGESGTGAALLAKKKSLDVFVSEQGLLKDKYKTELVDNKIDFEEAKHTENLILNATLIIKSPGIPDKAEIVKKAREKNIEIIDELEFGYRYLKGKVIAVTGTNGKTTTTLLIYHLLKSAGLKVVLAGNVGFSLARQVVEQEHDWYVIEISSFQLDGITSFKPTIGILLNITPDHLDRYEYSMQNYTDSKFRLVQNMSVGETFIYYKDDRIVNTEVKKRSIAANQMAVSLFDASAQIYFDGTKMIFRFSKIFHIAQEDTTLKGPHNLINTMAAVSAANLAGVSLENIRKSLSTFKNAPHRLESIATIKGIEFVNDSKATNVDSVVYALESYKGPLVWIAGGIDKGNDYTLIEKQVRKKVRTLICLGKDNEKLKKSFSKVVSSIKETNTVKELVRIALAEAKQGDVVLLSPACASFDLFKNYEDRGDQFRIAVLELKKEIEDRS